MTAPLRRVAPTLAALGLVGALAGCTAGSNTTPGGDDAPVGPAPVTPTGPFADGDYEATGRYISPNGTESIDVQLTLVDEIVTELEVVSHPSNPNTRQFQGQFISGIDALVVGKRIDELEGIDRVAGSSLTSGGFADAIAQIMTDAAG